MYIVLNEKTTYFLCIVIGENNNWDYKFDTPESLFIDSYIQFVFVNYKTED